MKNYLRFKTRKELSTEPGISPSTLRRRLKAANIQLPPGDVSPKHQKAIYEMFGYPPNVNKKDYKAV